MRIKLRPFCFSLCCYLAAASVSAAPFTSPHGYSLSVPAGWHIASPSLPGDDADVDLNQQVAAGHQMTTPIFQVQFRPVNSHITSADLGAINRGALSVIRQRFPDLKVLSQTFSTLNGVRDLGCDFTATVNSVPLHFHEVLVVKNNRAFTFTGICPSPVYPRYAATYAQMLSSVRWKN